MMKDLLCKVTDRPDEEESLSKRNSIKLEQDYKTPVKKNNILINEIEHRNTVTENENPFEIIARND